MYLDFSATTVAQRASLAAGAERRSVATLAGLRTSRNRHRGRPARCDGLTPAMRPMAGDTQTPSTLGQPSSSRTLRRSIGSQKPVLGRSLRPICDPTAVSVPQIALAFPADAFARRKAGLPCKCPNSRPYAACWKSGDGGNRTHVRDRARGGVYERSRCSDLVP